MMDFFFLNRFCFFLVSRKANETTKEGRKRIGMTLFYFLSMQYYCSQTLYIRMIYLFHSKLASPFLIGGRLDVTIVKNKSSESSWQP